MKRILSGIVWNVGPMLFAALLIGPFLFTACGEAEAHSSTPNVFYSFSPGETLTAAKLNNNFDHLHFTLTGRITNGNIATNAAIQHNKLAVPLLVPKAIGRVTGASPGTSPCAGSPLGNPCSVTFSSGIASVQGLGPNGMYRVTITNPPGVGDYIAIPQSTTPGTFCTSTIYSSSGMYFGEYFDVVCYDHAGALTNVSFNVVVYY